MSGPPPISKRLAVNITIMSNGQFVLQTIPTGPGTLITAVGNTLDEAASMLQKMVKESIRELEP